MFKIYTILFISILCFTCRATELDRKINEIVAETEEINHLLNDNQTKNENNISTLEKKDLSKKK